MGRPFFVGAGRPRPAPLCDIILDALAPAYELSDFHDMCLQFNPPKTIKDLYNASDFWNVSGWFSMEQ